MHPFRFTHVEPRVASNPAVPLSMAFGAAAVPAPVPARPTTRREDESADPVGDGHSDAEFAATQPPVPGRENPGPDTPEPVDPDDKDVPDEEGDVERHRPGHPHPA